MKIGKLVLGTVQFGIPYGINNPSGQLSVDCAHSVLDKARESGIEEIDTADAYGTAPEVLNAYFLKNPSSFKVFSKMGETGVDTFTQHLRKSCHRLGVNHLDGYYFHRFSDFLKFKNFQEIQILKEEGLLGQLGVSIYTEAELEKAAAHDEVDVIQLPFNVLDCSTEKIELINQAKQSGKKIYARSVFLQGLFLRESKSLPQKLQPLQTALRGVHQLAEESHLTVEELCLGYVLSREYIDKVLIGVDSVEQLSINLESTRKEVDSCIERDLQELEVTDKQLLNPATWGVI
ncbi:MAG: aldo/keto reductase [Chlamydiae bacterium]|nr:aldo/keto reductase [Chlamydiota bacterium]